MCPLGFKLNAGKTKTMIVFRCIPSHPLLTLGGTVLKESADLAILGVTFGSVLVFAFS